jgi:GntR family transcriptional regulator
MNKINKNDPTPLYKQLKDILVHAIEDGELKPHTAIPSESELDRMFGVSRMTVRTACSQLVQEGLLYRVPGKGTFVSDNKIETESLAYVGFREQLERMGYETTTKVLSMRKIEPNSKIANKLKLGNRRYVLEIERLRYLKDLPISLHYSYIPLEYADRISEEELKHEQLCVLLDRNHNLQSQRVIETLESSTANAKEAELFNIKEGYPLLILEDLLFNQIDVPYEYSKVVFRGDKIKLHYEYKK